MSLPTAIQEWLRARGLTDAVIAANGLDWNGTEIVIPIKDVDGKVLFNKFRRNPFTTDADVPKYRYAYGSTSQLFGVDTIFEKLDVVICEGEFDAMRLQAYGYCAVSSTGGAGTFKDEWLHHFIGRNVYVCYDNDEAGLKGGVKLLTRAFSIAPKLVVLPAFANGKPVKDVTDFLQAEGDFYQLVQQAEQFPFLSEPVPEFKTIASVHEFGKKFRYHLELLMVKERNAKREGKAYVHYDAIRSLLLIALENLDREERRIRFAKRTMGARTDEITPADIEEAKRVPLDTLYQGTLRKVGNKAVGCCPFHQESTGSFTVYLDQNTWHCYGCSEGRDAIDFVMKRDSIKFIDAVKLLTGK